MMNHRLIGVDIGGTSIKAALVADDGAIGNVHTAPTPTAEYLLGTLSGLIETCIGDARTAGVTVHGIGAGCPGIVSSDGTVLTSNNLRLDRFPLASSLSARFGLPAAALNDALCATLAEFRFGAGVGARNLAMLTIGTGVGCGLILNGNLFVGSNGCTAGGHMVTQSGGSICTCGGRGCLETTASATALIGYAREAAEADANSLLRAGEISGKTVFEALAAQDAAAERAFSRFVGALGDGVVSLMNLLRPERIVIGGGVSAQGERLTRPLRDYVSQRLFIGAEYAPFEIVTAKLGNPAGIVGAAVYADEACGLHFFR